MRRYLFSSLIAPMLLVPGIALTDPLSRPVGVTVFAGYNTYAMSDVNNALRSYALVDPAAAGQGGRIRGGVSAGGGIKGDLTDHLSLAINACWMQARSRGTTTISGVPYDVVVDIPAVSLVVSAAYLVPVHGRFRAGGTAGVGYYFTTGELRLRHDFLTLRSDMEARTFGVHGSAVGQIRLGSLLSAELHLGYRHAKARSLRVENVEVRRPTGERVAPDWSGVTARFALVGHLIR